MAPEKQEYATEQSKGEEKRKEMRETFPPLYLIM